VNVVQSERHRDRNDRRHQRRAVRDRSRDDRGSLRSRRETKPPEERRRDILDAALHLFATQGFNETSVQDIAAAAGMATGTVYLYFPSKEHVLQGLHDRFRDENDDTVTATAVDAVDRAARGEDIDYRDTIDAILDALAAHFKQNPELVLVCTRYRPELMDPDHAPGPQHLGIVGRALAAGVELGRIHTSDPEMTAYLFDAALSYNLHMHITYGDPPDMDRLIAAAKEMFHKALALPDEPLPPRKRTAAPAVARGKPRGPGSHRSPRVR
jgi:AcrR family transcriptional regulator